MNWDAEGERGPRRGRGRGFGRPGGWQNVDVPPADDAAAWFEGRLPSEWFTGVSVIVDREEITVIGTLPDEAIEDDAAAEGRIGRFRADTRARRIEIAEEALPRILELASHPASPAFGSHPIEARCAAYALLEFGNGAVASVNSSWAVRVNRRELVELQVDGTSGSAVAAANTAAPRARRVTRDLRRFIRCTPCGY